ncbi:hypothetical protein [Actinomadura sp. 7K507]|uniref:hypothetical protein n=1 Tax=Actinomadura sp. 7K507 TaxID=2530365 RepID=UPI001051605B|nr:hypothetical protein [Actinomadura sp. 7K507]TDC89147.1 hypothetical protein E1285_17025 [Actinomadura sp. 7K507]
MSAAVRATPLTALACAMALAGGLLIFKGMYGWTNHPHVAAQPLQRDRVVVYLAALLVAAGAAVFAVSGARGPALAVLATAIIPVLLILPGSYNSIAIYPTLITLTVGAAMALRTMLAPEIPVTLVSVLAFVVITVAGGYLLRGLLDVTWFPDGEVRAPGRLVCGLAGLALAAVPLMWLFTGHRSLAALSAPFLLVVVIAILGRYDALGFLVYAITGPMALGAAIYALFADR